MLGFADGSTVGTGDGLAAGVIGEGEGANDVNTGGAVGTSVGRSGTKEISHPDHT